MIFTEEPKDFEPRFRIVSCFFEWEGKILLLHRHKEKSQGDKWGVPAGKMDPGETPTDSMLRELWEETGVRLSEKDLNYCRTVWVRYPDYDFVYDIFHTQVKSDPKICIAEKEHQDFCWATPKKALKKNLVNDLDGCINLFYG